MTNQFTIVIEEGEDGYLISEVLELPGCHTQGKTLDELMQRTKEAISICLEHTKDQKIESKFLGIQQLRV